MLRVDTLKTSAIALLSLSATLSAQMVQPGQQPGPYGDQVDLAVLNQIKQQTFNHSQVMDNLYYLSEVHGPRVNNSRNHRAAAEWAMERLRGYGVQNVHLEKWGPSVMAGRSKSSMARSSIPRMFRSLAFLWPELQALTAR